MLSATLPVLMALSWVPVSQQPVATADAAPQKSEQTAQTIATIKCPITGEQISPCCCPVKK